MTSKELYLQTFTNKKEFDQYYDKHQKLFEERWRQGLPAGLTQLCEEPGKLKGYCGVCQRSAVFAFDATAKVPNLREDMTCSHCGLNARIRVVVEALRRELAGREQLRIYITEQSTPLYRLLKRRYRRVTGSEYLLAPWVDRLRVWLRHHLHSLEKLNHQDVTRLSFADQDFDALVSCDVLEHVPDYQRALREFARVLRPGGALVLTVPFLHRDTTTNVRARVNAAGNVEHLQEPEYHGDPVRFTGILAFYNFAWDLLDRMREAGFADAAWCLPWQPEQGIFDNLWVLVAHKSD